MADTSEQLHDDLPRLSVNDPLANIRRGYRPVDITDEFKNACQGLNTGQLVQHEGFSLWDAVQALEIMDPKMDSGRTEPGDNPADEFDVSQDLLPGEIIWIMDEILCRELAWLRGFALFQTVFTSVHILHLLLQYRQTQACPQFIKEFEVYSNESSKYTHWCLHAFCLSTIIQCDMNAELVASQQYYEEEDLNTQTYGLNLCTKIGDEECLNRLNHAMTWLQDRKASESDRVLGAQDDAIWSRLRLRRTLMTLFMHGQNDDNFDSFKDEIQRVGKTHFFNQRCERSFDAKAYRKLAIGGPTREPVSLEFSEAIEDLHHLHRDFIDSNRMSELGDVEPTSEVVQAILVRFTEGSPQPGALARAKLQAQLFSPGMLYDVANVNRMPMEMRSLVLEDPKILDFAAAEKVAPQSALFQRVNTLSKFMDEHMEIVVEHYRALCQNRSRMRRCLANCQVRFAHAGAALLVSDLKDPVHRARDLIRRNFVYGFLAAQCTFIILLGFEQDLYEDFEIGSMYSLVNDSSHYLQTDNSTAKARLPPTNSMSAERKRYLAALSSESSIPIMLAAALSCLYGALEQLGAVRPYKSKGKSRATGPNLCPQTSRQKLWELRIAPLRWLVLQDPEVQDFDNYYSLYRGFDTRAKRQARSRTKKPEQIDLPRANSNLLDLLETASKSIDIAETMVKQMQEDESLVEALFELPMEHPVVSAYREEQVRRQQVIVLTNIEIAKLLRAIPRMRSPQDVVMSLKPGYTVKATIPTMAERMEKAQDGWTIGHRWWVVPKLEVTAPKTKLDEVD